MSPLLIRPSEQMKGTISSGMHVNDVVGHPSGCFVGIDKACSIEILQDVKLRLNQNQQTQQRIVIVYSEYLF